MISFEKLTLKKRYKVLAWIFVCLFLFYICYNFLYSEIFKVVPDSAYHFLSEVNLDKNFKKILVFSPHPDDEVLSSAGLISQARKKKIEVKIVLITDGNRRGKGLKRQKEFKQAAFDLGLNNKDLEFWQYKDGYLKNVDQEKLRTKIVEEINQFKPQIVIYPAEFDQHKDHSILGLNIEDVLKNKKNITSFKYLVHFHGFPFPRKLKMDAYLMPPASLFFNCQWYKFTLTVQNEEKKHEVLNDYKTSLSYPMEKNFLESFVRQNELFCR